MNRPRSDSIVSQSAARGLRVLALDGGGVRGLAELLTLQELMKEVIQDTPTPLPADELQPWKYFDIICGSGTGGLLALMLGRLRMSIKDAVFQYRLMTQEVFNNPKLGKETEIFKLKRLHDVFQRLVKRFGPQCDRAEGLLDPEPGNCRVFVCASIGGDSSKPQLLRTYKLPENSPPKMKVADAACATMSHPTFFKAAKTISSSGVETEYLGDTLGCNNPCGQAIREVTEKLRLPFSDVDCLISIGSGAAPRSNLPAPDVQSVWKSKFPTTIHSAVRELASEAEVVHHEMVRQFKERPDAYFRFDVQKGMENIAWGDWRHETYIQGKVAGHFGEARVDQRAAMAAGILRKKYEHVRSDSGVSMQGMTIPLQPVISPMSTASSDVFAVSPT